MQETIEVIHLSSPGQHSRCSIADFDQTIAHQVNKFHASFPEYSITPLTFLSTLAQHLGIQGLYVKDESFRFGLNAFKVLGWELCHRPMHCATTGLQHTRPFL